MSEFKITCPSCGIVVTANDVMKKHLEISEESIRNELKKEINDIRASAKIEADKENQEKIDKINKDADAKQANLKKEINDIRASAKIEADKENQEKIDKINKNQEIENRRLQDKIDGMRRQIEQKSTEVQGEVQEELIEDFISKKFPTDRLETIKKGANGADSMLTIKSPANESIGKILIESKNTKDFSQKWIPKILNDIKNANADMGIIITKALPKSDFPSNIGYKPYEGGLVCVVEFKYPLVHMMVDMLRSKIISSSKNQNNPNINEELKKLWEVITSPKFTTQFRMLYNNLKKIDESSKKIDSTIRKQTADQQKYIYDSLEIQKEMILNMVSQIGSDSLPEKLIEFDDND